MDYHGYLFVFDENRSYTFNEYCIDGRPFADTISAPDWGVKQSEIFLISIDGETIFCAALATRGNIVATQKYKITFSNYVIFTPSINFEEIAYQLPPNFKSHFIRSSTGFGKRVPPNTWRVLIETINKINPQTSNDLARLLDLIDIPNEYFSRDGIEIISHERDAINIALRISGFDPKKLLSWKIENNLNLPIPPFLAGLSDTNLLEDTMINHDASIFGNWKNRSNGVISTLFEQNGEFLSVTNVNRHKIERTLGVDLFYYHHKYKSYVMVQYKRMINETDLGEKKDSEYKYRFDGSYQKEIDRMKSYSNRFSKKPSISEILDFRLHETIFYFKLCQSKVFDLTSTDMISGMYFPLDYWELLIKSPNIHGLHGGKYISWENAGRHLNNSQFVDLVGTGWIGSKSINSDSITKIIQNSLRHNSVILAAHLPNQT